MAWLEYYGTLINLQNVRKIGKDYKKIIFHFDKNNKVEIAFSSEEEAKKVYEYIVVCLETGRNFIKIDKIEEQSEQNK